MADTGTLRGLLTTEQAADYLGVSTRKLEKLRSEGGGPKYSKLGYRTIRYRPAALEAWISDREQRHVGDAPGGEGS